MRVQSRVLIGKICVRNVVIFVPEINGSAAAGREQLHSTTKLSSKVELLSGAKHPMIEVQEAATACQKGFDVAIVHEVYLRTDRAAADSVRICPVPSTGVPVTDQGHGYKVENPAHREGATPIDKAFIAAL